MRLVIIPPYRGGGYDSKPKEDPWFHESIASMERRGQLKGVEVEIDEGFPLTHTSETRDEEYFATVSVGVIKRVKECSLSGKYDAIATTAPLDMGFFAAQVVSKIPIAFALHSAIHIASIIGERFSIVEMSNHYGERQRRMVESYGLSHKLVSVRAIDRTSTYLMVLVREYLNKGRDTNPEVERVIEDILAQCKMAIEKERADTLVLGGAPFQCLENEIRRALDNSGYNEIPIVWMLPAAVEMAKAMVNMKLGPAPRAYPTDFLKARPEFR